MFKTVLQFILIFFIVGCNSADKNKTVVSIITNLGDIEVELYPDKAPKTVAAFLRNVEDGAYKNAAFYRVIKADPLPNDYNTGLIQGGVYGSSKGFPKIEHESTKQSGLSHTNGVISMARLEVGTASTEFFICIGDQSPLDYGRRGTADSLGMAAFGKVIKGMNVVRKIQSQPSNEDRFVSVIKIQNIKVE